MVCTVVDKKCVNCERQLRKGYLVMRDPLLAYPREIEYNVCQKNRVAILTDGSRVPLNDKVEVI